ncbi:recombinase family protein [Facklamia miroungae]|nr:recombinase family protein [Facklamia miroungae]
MKELKHRDTLVLCKLDRLARSTKDDLSIIEDLLDREIKINVISMGIIDNTPVGKINLHSVCSVCLI